MANAFYTPYREWLLAHLATDTIKAQLVDAADYTYSAAHQYLSDIPSGARVGAAVTLTSKSITGGVFDAADASVPTVTGDPAEAVVLYVDTGVEATSRLICYLDSGAGLPVTPNGNAINLLWSNGANKIFSIGG
jgi:hypothetical protein